MGLIEYSTGITPVVYSTDDAYSLVQGTRDGATYTADWILARCKEGRVFIGNLGTATGPATFGAGAIDTTEFDYFISVPAGTTVIPLEISVTMEVWGTAALFEYMAVYGTGGVTGAGSSITPLNMRRGAPITSNCTVTGAAASGGTAITGVEFWRGGYMMTNTPTTANNKTGAGQETSFKWSINDSGYSPIIVGAGQLGIFMSVEAGAGFITVVWVEVPSTRIV